MCTMYFWIHYQ